MGRAEGKSRRRSKAKVLDLHWNEARNDPNTKTSDDSANHEGREFGIQLESDSEGEDGSGGDETELSS